ncbi:MAG: cache domain-containing protein [Kiritimatiellae bacterium]|nr:cache domain-containing protein [Kiritimatiellia bacterium]
MLKTKLLKAFATLVVVFALPSAFVGVRIIKQRVIAEAQTRVRLDLGSAWAVYNSKLREIETILRMASGKQSVEVVCRETRWSDPDVQANLADIRTEFGLDFLDVLAPDGRVMLRTTAPFATGDYKRAEPAVAGALKGNVHACVAVFAREELEREAGGLAERAFFELVDTPMARRTPRTEETRGMVMVAAAPVWDGAQVTGVVYGGMLVNRNEPLIDRIHDVVYKGETYDGAALGTATVFLHDTRVATTVRLANGNRALGTRVSKEVADCVLDNGRPWIGEAFVVRDHYLTAYEPIRDAHDQVIGMLYVGILKRPFQDAARSVLLTYIVLSLFALAIGLVFAFFLAGRLTRPLHRLVEAANRLVRGEQAAAVPDSKSCYETDTLTGAFNLMTRTLAEREAKLKSLNHSYMEMLGFVSHELKGPLGTLMNYAYLLRERKLGPLTDKQTRAVKALDTGIARLAEMVRHYLNLSRIENGELAPDPTPIAVADEVLGPILESLEPDIAEKGMHLENDVSGDLQVHADLTMLREIFENLVGNAVKYGRSGGRLWIRTRPEDGFIAFEVGNEGDGIPREEQGALFQKFSRVNRTQAERQQKGTGLGLFITKHLVEAHGGAISVASEPGAWAAFTFTVPTESPGNREPSARTET